MTIRAASLQAALAPHAAVPQATGLDPDEEATLRGAVAAFNRGDFYAAHDLFETLWGEPVWKGLVQAAVALHHHTVGNPKGWAGLPENAERLLTPYRAGHAGLDIGRFVDDFQAFFQAVREHTAPPPLPKLHRHP